MITLNGSTLEGGGQLVRVALALSAIKGIPVRIEQVRANRAPSRSRKSTPSGGLKESHLAALHWLTDVCGARTTGDEVGSQTFTFRPPARKGPLVHPAKSTIELKNPGSVWLILQAVLPFIVFSMNVPVFELTLKGGTNVSHSMSGEYVQQVLAPVLEHIGLPKIDVQIPRRGWANAASEIGEVVVRVDRTNIVGGKQCAPFSLQPFQITTRGNIDKLNLSIVAHTQQIRSALTETITTLAAKALPDCPTVQVILSESSGDARRTHVLLVAHTSEGWRIGRDILIERKTKNAKETAVLGERIAERVIGEMAAELKRSGCVDEYLHDQLVIYQALCGTDAEGKRESIVDGGVASDKSGIASQNGDEQQTALKVGDHQGTLHTRTVRWVCEQMLGDEIAFTAGGICRGVRQHEDSVKPTTTLAAELGQLHIDPQLSTG